jgi:hypothetical protein
MGLSVRNGWEADIGKPVLNGTANANGEPQL